MRIVLLHSPLVGPTTWSAVASQLRHAVDHVVVPDLRSAVTGDPPYLRAVGRVVASAVDRAPDDGPLLLVGHSGAGPLMPGVADECPAVVDALVYVDAGLPRPGTTWFERAPEDLADRVRHLQKDGRLPPWDDWFEPGAVAALVPDSTVLARFRHELPRLPMAVLAEPTPPVAWTGPSGYVLLSEGYRDDADAARDNGWPVFEYPSHHLAMLTEPGQITHALVRLCRLLVTG
jgi:pimeloyl-ACP methyl ester carboxylesterase